MIPVILEKPAHGGDIIAAAVRYGLNPAQIKDFSASINPLGPSEAATTAIQEGLAWLQHYPEPGAASLRRALAEYHGVEEECVVPGNGCMELMYLSARLFSPRRILCLAPSYREYGQGGLQAVPRCMLALRAASGFALDMDELAELMSPGDLLYIGHPNNPTGRLLNGQELETLAAWAEDLGAWLVVDEAFLDFAGPDAPSAVSLALASPRIMVLGSLTKFFSLPGLRLGYAVAHRSLARDMERLLPPWRVNSLAIAAGAASLRDRSFIEQTRAWLRESRSVFINTLQKVEGLRVYPSAANFLLADCRESGLTAAGIQERIGPQGYLIRNCGDFEGLDDYYFRLAIRRTEDNLRLAAALDWALHNN